MPGLTDLVAALMRDEKVRSKFNHQPEVVMAEYQLSSNQRAGLLSMNPATISTAIQDELINFQNTVLDAKEFPLTDPNFTPEPGGGGPMYPAPLPQVFRIRPKTAPAGGAAFELTIYGQSFSQVGTDVVINQHGSSTKLVVQNVLTFGTFRCSGVRVLVTPSGPAGSYDVTVLSCKTPPNPYGPFPAIAPNALTLT
jgi:hypothetical protein